MHETRIFSVRPAESAAYARRKFDANLRIGDVQRGAEAARGAVASAGLRMAPQQYAEAAPSVVSRMTGAAAGAELGSAKAPLYVTQVCGRRTEPQRGAAEHSASSGTPAVPHMSCYCLALSFRFF